MNKILIIEDNKTLAKLMARKIHSELAMEVDVAYQLSEAKLFLHKYKYFLVLSDLNLPDAPNGEVIDYLLKKGCRVLVLSSNVDKSLRQVLMKKNIIDYVTKGEVDDLHYILGIIQRLHKNQQHKILVVDDSMVIRKQMKAMLENLLFEVLTVAHGEEALGMIASHPDISLVLTDYNMPVMDGLELTREIRKTYGKNDLGIIAVSSNENDEIIAMFLKHGANDYIKKPFSKEEFSCRINNSIEALENIHIITNHADRDFLSGLYNRRYFYKNAEAYFKRALEEGEGFAIAMIDIDAFKKINDAYGHDAGDKIIGNVSNILRANTSENDIVSRFNGGEFCILLKNSTQNEAMLTFEKLRKKAEKSLVLTEKGEEIRFSISIGVALNFENTLEETINQADLMLYNAKQNGKNQIASN